MSQKFTLSQYMESGCMQLEIPLGVALFNHTNGMMCDGCPIEGTCEALKKMLKDTSIIMRYKNKDEHSETVREEAIRRGIGIKEVRRQRHAKEEAIEK